ncbi:MAG: hypothetical protein P8I94_00820 [Emcibacteraceae bacterium]|nr:hypothetical protein [Emcibacteraceae bacterium]
MSIIKSFLNKTVVISSLITLSLVTIPATAFADRGGKDKRIISNPKVIAKIRNDRREARRGNNNRPVVAQNRNGGRDARRGNARNYDKGYSAGRRDIRQNVRTNRKINRAYNNGYRRGNRNSTGAFVGGLIGGSILSSAYNNSHVGVSYNYGYSNYGYNSYGYGYPTNYNYGYPSYRYTPRTNVVYVERPPQTIVREVPVYTQGPSTYSQQGYQNPDYQKQPQQQAAVIDNNCLQTREYTTTIDIGGESVPAYGQACLQPDGSWMFGEPIAAPSF